ncbi:MAG: transcription elongation factor GreA [Elusimicrobiota bacterium]|jgi:transcription elongation factor GreA|nr:transcription elongation factor GreA [Elusimicrobiota bacterium]
MANIFLTRQGRENLIKELEELQKRKPAIQDEIARAREHGDFKENAEYHAAKETLTNLMRRISDINTKLSMAKLIDEQNIDTSKVLIGATVTIEDEDGEEWTYTLVDSEESDPQANKISVQSPLAQGLLEYKVGEISDVELPAGTKRFKIKKIVRS